MKSTMFVLGMALTACSGGSSDPCDGAKSGDACRWAGTGESGLNREHPTLDRRASTLDSPTDLTFGPDGRGYIVDWNNHMIRRVEKDQRLVRVVGTEYEGDGSPEMEDRLPVCHPAGALGTDVAMNHPTSATFGPDGLLYIAAWHNNKVRTFDPASGMVTTIAGNFYGYAGDGGPACSAVFNQPSSLAIADDGTIYVADQRNVRVRKIAPDSTITTIAGDGKRGNIGDGGNALAAEFGWDIVNTPKVSGALALDGNMLYIADSANNRIRRVHLDTNMIDCIAGGSSEAGYTGDGGPALQATFRWPSDLAMGPDGRLYVADRENHAIRAIDLSSGFIDTVVGDGQSCDASVGACADRAPAKQMELNTPYGITFDAEGNLYIADTLNNRIVKVLK